jgi:hypothetical protein
MTGIKSSAVSRAVALLNAAGAKFKVITAEGEEFGELIVALPKVRTVTRNTQFEHGERTAYIRAHLEGLKVGDTTIVPWGPYGDGLGNCVPPTAQALWGKRSYITETVDGGTEILRVA